ncbi:MAG TPA: hypothetical protein PKC18_16560, partial [Lacipirellulaceae bacterium]|nr:hypothetical protein [Lacipirellulaceae bacterium]
FGGGRGGYGGGEFGGGGGFDPSGVMQPQGPRYERRRFLDRVMAIYSGLQSVAAGGSAELKTRTADLAGPIKAAADLAANANTGDAQVTEAVVQLAREVNRVVEDWAEQDQPVAAAAADADGAAGEEFGE